MITHIRGILERKTMENVVIDACGIGYDVQIPSLLYEKLPGLGMEVKLFTVESTPMYGGGVTFYGFLTDEQRDLFLLLKEVPGTGARKALDYLEKILKSPADFRRFVSQKDASSVCSIFGFTKKTADKLVSALKDKIGAVNMTSSEKWNAHSESTPVTEAISGLVSLGYKESYAREAVDKAVIAADKLTKVEDIIKTALRYL